MWEEGQSVPAPWYRPVRNVPLALNSPFQPPTMHYKVRCKRSRQRMHLVVCLSVCCIAAPVDSQ